MLFQVFDDARIELRDGVGFVFVVAFFDRGIVRTVTSAEIFGGVAPRFFALAEAIEDLAEVVFFQPKEIGFRYHSADTPGQVRGRRQVFSDFAKASESEKLRICEAEDCGRAQSCS